MRSWWACRPVAWAGCANAASASPWRRGRRRAPCAAPATRRRTAPCARLPNPAASDSFVALLSDTGVVNVPLLDLVAQYRAIKDDVLLAVQAVIESQQFVMGPSVARLETAIAGLAHAKHGIACASGTDALLLPLKALDLKPGDEVVTTPFTFFATAGTIHNAGGTPVFVDIEPGTLNIDPAAVDAAITPRTRAVMPVHLYGQMAAMERLLPLARARGLRIIEHAAQPTGARRRIDGGWRMAGARVWV